MDEKEDVEMLDIAGNRILLKDVPIITFKDGTKGYNVDDLITAELKANAKRIKELEEEREKICRIIESSDIDGNLLKIFKIIKGEKATNLLIKGM